MGQAPVAPEATDHVDRRQVGQGPEGGQTRAGSRTSTRSGISSGDDRADRPGRPELVPGGRDPDRRIAGTTPVPTARAARRAANTPSATATRTGARRGRAGRTSSRVRGWPGASIATEEPGRPPGREADEPRSRHLDPWGDGIEGAGHRLEQPGLAVDVAVEQGQLGATALGIAPPLPPGHPVPPGPPANVATTRLATSTAAGSSSGTPQDTTGQSGHHTTVMRRPAIHLPLLGC